MKDRTVPVVLILALHVSEGCWLGQLELVKPVMEVEDAGCRNGSVPFKVKNADGLITTMRWKQGHPYMSLQQSLIQMFVSALS